MEVSIPRLLCDSMLDFALEQHPKEIVLLLRGKTEGGSIRVTDFLVPPLATSGRTFAEFPPHLLPIDFSIVGTAHSHPSGASEPSTGDLNNFYGRIMVLLYHPFEASNITVFNSKGERIPFRIVEN